MHCKGAGKVDGSVPQAPAIAGLSQPASAPSPATEDRVNEPADEDAVNEEALVAPAFAARAGDDGRSGVHECHHEQEHDDCSRVVARAAEEESGLPENAPSGVHRA